MDLKQSLLKQFQNSTTNTQNDNKYNSSSPFTAKDEDTDNQSNNGITLKRKNNNDSDINDFDNDNQSFKDDRPLKKQSNNTYSSSSSTSPTYSNNNNNDNDDDDNDRLTRLADLEEQRRELLDQRDDEELKYKWQWKDTNNYVDYSLEFSKSIERHYRRSKENFKVDNERYIDIKRMIQRRYDAPNRVREVRRVLVDDKNISKPLIHQQQPKQQQAPPSKPIQSISKPSQSTSTSTTTTKPTPVSLITKSNTSSPPLLSQKVSSNNNNIKDANKDEIWITSKGGEELAWFWQGDTQWEAYSNEMSQTIELAYGRNNKKANIDDDRYVDIEAGVQRRYDDQNKIRQIKRVLRSSLNQNNNNNQNNKNQNNNSVKQQTSTTSTQSSSSSTQQNNNNKPNTTSPVKSTPKPSSSSNNSISSYFQPKQSTGKDIEDVDFNNTGNGKWYWMMDTEFVAYDDSINEVIESAYVNGEQSIEIVIGRDTKIIDFKSSVQRRADDPTKRRPIKRVIEAVFNTTNQPIAPIKKSITNKTKIVEPKFADEGFFDDPPPVDIDQEDDNNNQKNDYVDDDIDLNDPDFREKKRRLYKCGEDYIELDRIPTWFDFIEDKRDRFKEQKLKLFAPSAGINKKVSLFGGDITTIELDGILNAAKQSLLGGGGIDGAIHHAAGRGLYHECRKLGGCPIGQSRITKGHWLPAKHIIHTVGPMDGDSNQLKSCYKTTLDMIVKNNIKTFAFCCVATGIYGFPAKEAAQIALGVVREWLESNHNKIDRLIFCVFTKDDYIHYGKLMQSYFPIHDAGDQ